MSPHPVAYGRDVCTDVAVSSAHEWLVTNGIGGFASGTIDGSATRRYHGLLIAALAPPAARTLKFSKVDERVEYRGASWTLATNRWASGSIEPRGYLNLERFFLDGAQPVWQFALGDGLLERRLVMDFGRNETIVRYRVVRGSAPMRLIVKTLVNDRDMHAVALAGRRVLRIEPVAGGVRVQADYVGTTPLWLRADGARVVPGGAWYRDYDLPAERERGLEDREDHLLAATFTREIKEGEHFDLRAVAEARPPLDEIGDPFERGAARETALLEQWRRAQGATAAKAPAAIGQLVRAADQFIVARRLPGFEGRSVIAGYHWFGDWGRDAMIALPGLALATGRYDVARTVLRTYDRFLDGGMLPNDFPERGSAPSYNSADAALWYVEAVRAYLEASGDAAAIGEFWPSLAGIVERYRAGTRFGIGVDPADGLLRAGVPGVQVTWMDAKVGGRVITPRIGKPVEVNALWYNALRTLGMLAPRAGADPAPYERDAERARRAFPRFHDDATGGLRDVLDGPGGDDRRIRPNQIFAAALPYVALEPSRVRAVVDCCARELLAPMGLRTLSPRDPDYAGRYRGSPSERDAIYHQGTVWPWLIGPFAVAHHRAYGDAGAALAFLDPLLDCVTGAGAGSLPELTDGDPPFHARGAIAQAWSVGEVLRAWHLLAAAA